VRRRIFLTLLSATAAGVLGCPSARGQRAPKLRRIGYLAGESQPTSPDAIRSLHFVQGLAELGYVEGRDYVMEWRFADWKAERLLSMARELVALDVDVLVGTTQVAVRAAQQATQSIPIIMAISIDPIQAGLVESLARPGGNTTGLSSANEETYTKQLDLLKAFAPNLNRIAFLGSPGGIPDRASSKPLPPKRLASAADAMGILIVRRDVFEPAEIEQAISEVKRGGAQAVIVASAALLNINRRLVAGTALKLKLPTISQRAEFAHAGGLMSYGESARDFHRRSAYYVDKIFKGAKPGDLPVELPTRFQFVINAKTAKALNLEIPPELFGTADEVIE
jgi:putative tryptophan/tyrosine transport system substrate-binding protein